MTRAEYLIGLDIGGTKCAVVLGRERENFLEILDKVKFPTRDFPHPLDCIGHMGDLLDQMFGRAGLKPASAAGIGVSCGGPLDSRTGVVMSPPNLPGWDNVPVVRLLQERFRIPAFLQNDANAGAVAEWRYGAGRGVENMIFLTFGTGLGSGLILNSRLYAGTNDLAGECGHLRLASHGPVGFGKSGSFEGFCSGGGIAQLAATRVRESLQNGRSVPWCPDLAATAGLNAKIVGDAAEAGDELALEVYRECGEFLGRGLSLLIDVLNPQRIVIGSVFARSELLLRPAMERIIAREAIPAAAAVCKIVPAELGEKIGDFAALSLASGNF